MRTKRQQQVILKAAVFVEKLKSVIVQQTKQAAAFLTSEISQTVPSFIKTFTMELGRVDMVLRWRQRYFKMGLYCVGPVVFQS